MKVIWHQTVSNQFNVGRVKMAMKSLKEKTIVFVLKENLLLIIPTVEDMVVMFWKELDVTMRQ